MSDYLRARSPEQKAERMEAIMAAAQSLFCDLPYHEINMGLIAKELGWSRSNLYKYVSTQEEVFLALHSRANRLFIDDLISSLPSPPSKNASFAHIWASVMDDHSEFLRYQDILIPIIESNASLERLIEFKKSYMNMLEPLLDILMKQVDCDKQSAYSLYLSLIFQAPGLYNHFHCSKRTEEAMKIAGIPSVSGSFVDAYTDFTEMCLTRYSKQSI